MRTKWLSNYSRGALCAGLAMMALPASAQAQASDQDAGPAEEAASQTGITDIVVTATRRESSLQRTAASIAALDGGDLRVKGVEGLQNIPALVSNVTFNNTSNVPQIYIRGVGNTFIQAGGDPGVAFYSENAYVTDQRTVNAGLFDIQRVEVLKGPQGALYGRNAVGGAVNVIFNKPTDGFEANADFVIGNYGRRESQGAVSGPLGFANTNARFSYQIKDFAGYTKNLAKATVPDAPARFDDHQSAAFRVQTETELGGDGRLNLMYMHYKDSQNGQALKVEPWQGFVYPAEVLFGAVPLTDPRSINATVGYSKLRVDDLNANLNQSLGDYVLTGTLSYRTARQEFLADCDSTILGDCTYFTGTRTKDFFSDVHVASPTSGTFSWLAGATYSHYTVTQVISVPTSSVLGYLGLTPADGAWPFNYLGGGDIKQNSFAFYLSGKAQLSSVFAVTGEIRYAETTKKLVEYLNLPFFGLDVRDNRVNLDNNFVPFKVGLEAQVTPDILLYGNYGTANKDGAVNPGAVQTSPVLPERARSAEIGFKTSFLDRRIQLNGAVFTTSYRNAQFTQVITNTAALANAPRSRIRGAEVSLIAAPTDRLRLSVNAGVLDAKFLEFSNAPTRPGGFEPVRDLAGNKLPYVPPYSVSADLGYRFALPGNLDLQTNLTYSHHGRVYFDEFQRKNNSQAAVGLLDFSASLSGPDTRWRLFGFVRNITDEVVASGATIYSPLLGSERAVSYAPPRTFGIGVAVSFD